MSPIPANLGGLSKEAGAQRVCIMCLQQEGHFPPVVASTELFYQRVADVPVTEQSTLHVSAQMGLPLSHVTSVLWAGQAVE